MYTILNIVDKSTVKGLIKEYLLLLCSRFCYLYTTMSRITVNYICKIWLKWYCNVFSSITRIMLNMASQSYLPFGGTIICRKMSLGRCLMWGVNLDNVENHRKDDDMCEFKEVTMTLIFHLYDILCDNICIQCLCSASTKLLLLVWDIPSVLNVSNIMSSASGLYGNIEMCFELSVAHRWQL